MFATCRTIGSRSHMPSYYARPYYYTNRWLAKPPKQARVEALAGLPPKPKALKTLEEEGVLNGYAANKYDAHYKNECVPDDIAEHTAKYMLHINIDDRRRYCEMLVTGNTSVCNVVKVIEAYRREQAALTHNNTMDTRRGDRVLVIDGNGVIH